MNKRSYGNTIYWQVPTIISIIYYLILYFVSNSFSLWWIVNCLVLGSIMFLIRPMAFSIIKDEENSDSKDEYISVRKLFVFVLSYAMLLIFGIVVNCLPYLGTAQRICAFVYVIVLAIFCGHQEGLSIKERVWQLDSFKTFFMAILPLYLPTLIVRGFVISGLLFIASLVLAFIVSLAIDESDQYPTED